MAITVIYLFTVELFPTTMRSTGFACCNIIARFSMIFLPMILSASATAIWLPAALMGIISTLGAFSTILLPDTKGRDLLDNLEDAEDFYSEHKFCCCWKNSNCAFCKCHFSELFLNKLTFGSRITLVKGILMIMHFHITIFCSKHYK